MVEVKWNPIYWIYGKKYMLKNKFKSSLNCIWNKYFLCLATYAFICFNIKIMIILRTNCALNSVKLLKLNGILKYFIIRTF